VQKDGVEIQKEVKLNIIRVIFTEGVIKEVCLRTPRNFVHVTPAFCETVWTLHRLEDVFYNFLFRSSDLLCDVGGTSAVLYAGFWNFVCTKFCYWNLLWSVSNSITTPSFMGFIDNVGITVTGPGLHRFTKKSRSHLKFQGAWTVTCQKVHDDDLHVLGGTAQNLVATATWCLGFVYP
jgi:hypothetical protein